MQDVPGTIPPPPITFKLIGGSPISFKSIGEPPISFKLIEGLRINFKLKKKGRCAGQKSTSSY